MMKSGKENQQLARRMLRGGLFWTVAHFVEKNVVEKVQMAGGCREQLESASALAGAVAEDAGGTMPAGRLRRHGTVEDRVGTVA